jgi:hypothetical protein
MKKTSALACGAIVALVLTIGLPLSAQAQTVAHSLDEEVAAAFLAQLEELAADSGDAMTFDTVDSRRVGCDAHRGG